MRSLILFVGLVLVGLIPPSVGRANLGLARDPAQWSGPHALAPANLGVESEQLRIVCAAGSDGRARCQFSAHYQIANPGTETEHALATFCGVHTRGVAVRVDGHEALRALDEAEVSALERSLGRVFDGPLRADTLCSARGIELVLGPAERREIVAEGVFEPGVVGVGSYAISASAARHTLVQPHRDPRPQRLQYLLAPIRSWQSVGPIEIEIRFPASWHSTARLVGRGAASAVEAPVEHVYQGDEHVMRMHLHAASADALELDLSPARPVVEVGGPILGVGGAFGSHAGFRLRAGWELTGPDWLLYGVAMDTNFTGLWVVTPTIEAASDFVLIIPSCGVGLGLPVRVANDTAIGIRGQLSMMFAPVGLSFGVDVFPRDETPAQLTLLGQVSL